MNVQVETKQSNLLYANLQIFSEGDVIHVKTNIGYSHAAVIALTVGRVSLMFLEDFIAPSNLDEITFSICDCEKD